MSGPQLSSSFCSFFELFSPPISFLFALPFNTVYSLITRLLSENCLHVSSFFLPFHSYLDYLLLPEAVDRIAVQVVQKLAQVEVTCKRNSK